MAKKILSLDEIKEVQKLLKEVFGAITKVKDQNPLAQYIKYPQIPSILTESIALHLLQKSLICPELEGFSFDFGGNEADIVATKGQKKLRIEIKATGSSAFQYFGEKDITADFLIWIHFGDFFMKPSCQDTDPILSASVGAHCNTPLPTIHSSPPLHIYTLKDPQKYFSKPLKITLAHYRKVVEKDLKEIVIEGDLQKK